jgi:hypothetical protein
VAARAGVAGDGAGRFARGVGVDGEDRQADRKRELAADAAVAGDFELAAHERDEAVADREAEAGAGLGRAAIGDLVERLEERREIGRGDADAGVEHGEFKVFRADVSAPSAKGDAAAGGELDRVAEEIVEDLAEFEGIADDELGEIGGGIENEFEFLLLGARAQRGGDVAKQLRQMKRRRAQLHACRPRSSRNRAPR